MTLGQVHEMQADELEIWREYHKRFGFPIDRLLWGIALSGAAICRANGSRVEPRKLLPLFWKPGDFARKELIAKLSSLPGAKVEWIPKGKTLDGSR